MLVYCLKAFDPPHCLPQFDRPVSSRCSLHKKSCVEAVEAPLLLLMVSISRLWSSKAQTQRVVPKCFKSFQGMLPCCDMKMTVVHYIIVILIWCTMFEKTLEPNLFAIGLLRCWTRSLLVNAGIAWFLRVLAVPRREEASNAEALAQKKRMQPNKAGCLQAPEIIVVCRH